MLRHRSMTDRSGPSAQSATGEGQAVRAGYYPTEDGDQANRQRRTIQNRKNQRAHRLRTKEQGLSTTVRKSRPFQVTRWRLDSPDDLSDTKGTVISSSTSNRPPGTHSTALSSRVPVKATGQSQSRTQTNPTPPLIIFPLSADHLLHLVQYNVFRAFVSNKRTLNLLLTGWSEAVLAPSPSSTSCPISGPYRDDTSVFPLNPNIPSALTPTPFQQNHPHPIWINLIPFPRLRDNLIRCQGEFDHWQFLQDLIGELMGANQFQNRRQALPETISVSDPEPHDEDAMTKGRKGLVVWGEPHRMQNWEATPGFFANWAWAVEGCGELLEHSNRWRRLRGEDPICLEACRVQQL
jgi:hypothetical protein